MSGRKKKPTRKQPFVAQDAGAQRRSSSNLASRAKKWKAIRNAIFIEENFQPLSVSPFCSTFVLRHEALRRCAGKCKLAFDCWLEAGQEVRMRGVLRKFIHPACLQLHHPMSRFVYGRTMNASVVSFLRCLLIVRHAAASVVYRLAERDGVLVIRLGVWWRF